MRELHMLKTIGWCALVLSAVAFVAGCSSSDGASGAGTPAVTVDVGSVSIKLSETADIAATSTDPSDTSFTWTVDTPGVVSISVTRALTSVATVTGNYAGTATITATADQSGLSASSDVIVNLKSGYVGSATCAGCHQSIYDSFILTGHPFKVNEVTNNQPPEYPFAFFLTQDVTPAVNAPLPPIDWDGSQIGWDEVTYVIGGWGWKARFMDTEGYIMTQFDGADPQGRTRSTQWNPPTFDGQPDADRWAPYSHPSADQVTLENARKPYNCGACHTTGWEAATQTEIDNFASNLGAFQDGLPGIHGSWSEPGVHCEECHGPGESHALAPSASNITVILTDAPDSEPGKRCGECHTRDSQNRIEASGSPGSVFIRHHEQYDEFLVSTHWAIGLNCVDCHDPHQPTRYTPSLGVPVDCTTCHPGKQVDRASMSGLDCVDCHMPGATKSGIKYGDREGDVRTHIFTINPNAVGSEEPGTAEGVGGMFYNDLSDGKLVSNPWVTLDFACQWCHDGVNASSQDLAALAAVAPLIHN